MKLSVSMITYNHEKFIRQAIESVLMQKADFDYELVIGEDHSADHTYEIASEYQRAHPDRVRVLRSESNIGSNRNFIRTFQACRGDYVATIDGDDYWISPLKLQKQVGFLEQHPDCVMCYHNVRSFWEDGSRPPDVLPLKMRKSISTIEDLLVPDHFMPNSSVVFRNGLVKDVPDWFYSIPLGDWPLHVFHARFGNIGYMEEVLGAYRRHADGVLQRRNFEVFWLGELKMYQDLAKYLDGQYSSLIKGLISHRYHLLASYWENKGDRAKARSYALRRIALRPFDNRGKNSFGYLVQLCAPPALYKLYKACRRAVSHTH